MTGILPGCLFAFFYTSAVPYSTKQIARHINQILDIGYHIQDG
jgi:hypothetical protein